VPPFLVCVHDATPAYARETRAMIRDLAPLLGRRLSFGVVPDWHGEWPLTAHHDYCSLLNDASAERLLHGYTHRRQRGRGPASWLAERCDEMNGLDPDDTRRAIDRGRRVFADVFGEAPRGFVAPGWQRGHVRPGTADAPGLEHVLGFFSLDSSAGRRVPLSTWTWDCGRWGRLGHVGHGIGRLRHHLLGGVPSLAIHPRDLHRGFWPRILGLTRELLDAGHEPSTVSALLDAPC
jgi:hypothetical protein